jgi:hypothetical protein
VIEFTTQNDEKVAVNPALVWHVRRAAGIQTAIYAATGAALFVQEVYDEVVQRIDASGFGPE